MRPLGGSDLKLALCYFHHILLVKTWPPLDPVRRGGVTAQGHEYLKAYLVGNNLWRFTTILCDSKADNVFTKHLH